EAREPLRVARILARLDAAVPVRVVARGEVAPDRASAAPEDPRGRGGCVEDRRRRLAGSARRAGRAAADGARASGRECGRDEDENRAKDGPGSHEQGNERTAIAFHGG